MNRFSGLCVGLTALVATGCTEEVKRFDVELLVTRAADVEGGTSQYSYVDNLGITDGSGVSTVQGLRVGFEATSIQFTVETVGSSVPGLGRSPFLPIVDNETLVVPVLVAPLDAVGLVSKAPADLGGDACVAADGAGNLFLVGGSESEQPVYAYTTGFVVRTLDNAPRLTGVAGLGCAAFRGAVAAVGGCTVREVQLIQLDGAVTTFPVALEEPCGAMAAPAPDGGVWVVDGRGNVSLRSSSNDVLYTDELGAAPEAIEVTSDGSLVALAGNAHRLSPTTGKFTTPATALGRRGDEVLVLDGAEVKVVGEDNAVDLVRDGVTTSAKRFVMLSDTTVVTLEGSAVTIFDADGSTSTLTASREHTAIAAIPGDTVLLAGGAGAGFEGFSRR